jgi:pimeloyl-ACP methyl ester carboxylesterase
MPSVLVHGVPDTPHLWAPVRSHLSRDDVLAPALPGFVGGEPEGWPATKEAYADWLVAELEAVGEPVDLVGHDWGGILCVRVATTRPDLVRTLVVGGCPVDPDYVWHEFAQLLQQPEVGEQVTEGITPETMGPGLEAAGLPEDVAAEAAARITPTMAQCILRLYRSAVHVGTDWPIPEGLPFSSLLLWGGDDPYVPLPIAESMARRLGADGVHVFEGCGHWWPAERPSEVALLLEQHWAR